MREGDYIEGNLEAIYNASVKIVAGRSNNTNLLTLSQEFEFKTPGLTYKINYPDKLYLAVNALG